MQILYSQDMSRPLLLIGLPILIIVLYGVFVSVRTIRLISKSAILVKDSRRFERINGGSPRILVIGDSTGVGTGVKDPAGSVAGRFGQDYPNAEIKNVSVNGWKVADALKNFPNAPAQSFDLVVLQIGANDIIRRTPMDAFTRDLALLFAQAKVAGKNVVALHSGNVGLAPFFSWPLGWYYGRKTLAYRAQYMRIAAEKNVTYVNLLLDAKDDPFLTDIPRYYAPDLLHLTEDGYGYWYSRARETMKDARISL